MGLGVGGVDGGRVVGLRGILLVLVLLTKGEGGGAVGVVRRTCSKGRRGKPRGGRGSRGEGREGERG